MTSKKKPSKGLKSAGSRTEILRKQTPVSPADISLRAARGNAERGGGPGGHYWHIEVKGKRAGYIFINVIRDAHFGEHPSIQIHLNVVERGKQIGRTAYKLACEQCSHPVMYAHMSRKNIASQRAAEEAGFRPIDEGLLQFAMIWHR